MTGRDKDPARWDATIDLFEQVMRLLGGEPSEDIDDLSITQLCWAGLADVATALDLIDEALQADKIHPDMVSGVQKIRTSIERMNKVFATGLDNADTQITPYAKMINSWEVEGFSSCFHRKPNAKFEVDGKVFDATTISVGRDRHAAAVWMGGTLKPVGIKLALFIQAKFEGQLVITFTLQEFMKYAGLTHRKSAAEAVDTELQKLRMMNIEAWMGDKTRFSGGFSLWGTAYGNNRIVITLTQEGYSVFSRAKGFKYFPYGILTPSLLYNPNSLSLAAYFISQKAMNWGKQGCDIYDVLDTIDRATDLPKPEDVKNNHSSRYTQFIIKPFERDMNAMSHIFSWEYIKGSGNSWKEFKTAAIKVTFINHPQDQLVRIRKTIRKGDMKIRKKPAGSA